MDIPQKKSQIKSPVKIFLFMSVPALFGLFFGYFNAAMVITLEKDADLFKATVERKMFGLMTTSVTSFQNVREINAHSEPNFRTEAGKQGEQISGGEKHFLIFEMGEKSPKRVQVSAINADALAKLRNFIQNNQPGVQSVWFSSLALSIILPGVVILFSMFLWGMLFYGLHVDRKTAKKDKEQI